MSAIDFPARGRKFCPMCEAAVLTVWQLEAHMVECHRRTASSGDQHGEDGTREPNTTVITPVVTPALTVGGADSITSTRSSLVGALLDQQSDDQGDERDQVHLAENGETRR